ncbi:type II toxin-antitoxin system VapC family toxin [Pseudonocardia sp. C8]|uniref:type II toxin-antitoxin system VapC family toxin n=1 Tax=Pseudonocardia sp. C8 TaxID=2762759 RepID=UPI002107A60C|nr:type II toxin-antitoxin system VapC family toxin [Pseudonocardia sp. C8]
MMLVLDTHALLWTLLDPTRIPERTLERIRDPRTDLAVSAASAWEIATKVRLGKLAGAEAVVHGYLAHLELLGAGELPITSSDALTAGSLTWTHRDPFDRMIVAQCIARSYPLVTADEAVTAFGAVTTIW